MSALPYIPQFRDADVRDGTGTGLYKSRPIPSLVDVSVGDAVSPAGDLLASLNFRICDTTQKCYLKKNIEP